MKIKALIITLLILFTGTLGAYANQIPRNLRDYLQDQRNVPTVRFDGIILYNDNTMYIPVIPAHPKKVEQIKIVKTYPANQSMDAMPDMVLFNNNYGLLKIIKTSQDSATVRNMPVVPEEILSGVIPQDILVPRGLVFPENLAGILGDVQVPFVGSAKAPVYVSAGKTAPLPSGNRVIPVRNISIPEKLKNKLFFVNNFRTEYLQVFSSEVSEPLYSLKTSGVVKDMKSFGNGRYLLAATNGQKNLDVIDVKGEMVLKHIGLTANPSEIAVDEANKIAYVASEDDESLFVINLETYAVKEKIQLAGAPQRLSISKDGTKLAYADLKTSNVYILDMTNGYENKLITKYSNITKLILDENRIYMIARTSPALRVAEYDLFMDSKTAKTKKDKRNAQLKKDNERYNAEEQTTDVTGGFNFRLIEEDTDSEVITSSTSIKDFEIGTKPTDMESYGGKIFVLCAGDNSVYTYDKISQSVTSTKLPMEGFSKSFSRVPGTNLAIVTNMGELKYAVYDMDANRALHTVGVSEYINMVTVTDRK